MLNFVYYIISFVLWFWHKVFSFVLSPTAGITWVLAIVFLTWTVRIILVKPMMLQMRSSMKMQEMQPEMKAIRERYKGDQQKLMEETRKLQKQYGVNPVAGCLPAVIQAPVFIGLFHVLRSFNRTGHGHMQLGLTIEQNRNTPNYFFGVHDVQSFLDARLFGVPLSAYISMPSNMFQAFQPVDFNRIKIAFVAIPLIIITALATHFNARMSVNRIKARQAASKNQPAEENGMMMMQTQMMNKLMVWVFPFSILLTGAFWHIGLLCYMVSNNIWTYVQQYFLFKKMDKEEAEMKAAKRAAKKVSAPKVGVKPVNPKKTGQRGPAVTPAATVDDEKAKAAELSGITESKGLFGSFKKSWQTMKNEAYAQAAAKQEAAQQSAPVDVAATEDTEKPSAPDSTTPPTQPQTRAPKPGQKPQQQGKQKKNKPYEGGSSAKNRGGRRK